MRLHPLHQAQQTLGHPAEPLPKVHQQIKLITTIGRANGLEAIVLARAGVEGVAKGFLRTRRQRRYFDGHGGFPGHLVVLHLGAHGLRLSVTQWIQAKLMHAHRRTRLGRDDRLQEEAAVGPKPFHVALPGLVVVARLPARYAHAPQRFIIEPALVDLGFLIAIKPHGAEVKAHHARGIQRFIGRAAEEIKICLGHRIGRGVAHRHLRLQLVIRRQGKHLAHLPIAKRGGHYHIAGGMRDGIHRTSRRIRPIGRRVAIHRAGGPRLKCHQRQPTPIQIHFHRPGIGHLFTDFSRELFQLHLLHAAALASEGKLHKFIFQCGSGFLYHRFRRSRRAGRDRGGIG